MVTFGIISLCQRLASEVKCCFLLHNQSTRKIKSLQTFAGLNVCFLIQIIFHFPWCIYLLWTSLAEHRDRERTSSFLYLTTCVIQCLYYRVTWLHATLILELSQSGHAVSVWANHSATTPDSGQSCEWTHFQMLSIFYEFPSIYFNREL